MSRRLILGAMIMVALGLWVGVRVAQYVVQDVDPGARAIVQPWPNAVATDGDRGGPPDRS